jgi:hypothetical protein
MAEVIMVIATAVMAIFSALTWYVSWQLKKDGVKRDAEVHNLFMKLTAGVMASGQTAGNPPIAARLFVDQEAALREAIEKA